MTKPLQSPSASDEPPSRRGGTDGGTEQATDKAYVIRASEPVPPETAETTVKILGLVTITFKSVTGAGSEGNNADAYWKVGLITGFNVAVPMAGGAMLGAAPELSLYCGTGFGVASLILYYAFWGRCKKRRSSDEPRGSTS